MSAPDAGSAAAVTKPSNCDRIVFIEKEKYVIKHSWRLHSVPGKVQLVTKLIDNKHQNRPSNTVRGLAGIADYYLRGGGSEATAAAWNEGQTPQIHMFTDRYGKQYKERRNFRFLADSVQKIGFFVYHHFAATSHAKVATTGSAASP